MNSNRSYANFGRQVIYVLVANIATSFLGLVQLPILTKTLESAEYGTWALIQVTVSLLVPLGMLGFSSSIVRFLSAEKDWSKVSEDIWSACCTVFIAGSVLSAFLFLFSDYLAAQVLKDGGSSSVIKLAAVLILLDSLDSLTLNFFRAQRRIGLFCILSVGRRAVQVGLIGLALLLGSALRGAVLACVLAGVLFVGVQLLVIVKQTGLRIPRFSNTKTYLAWGLPLVPDAGLLWVIHVSDRYVVGYFLGVAAAGVYSAAYAIGDYASFFLAPLSTVLYPTIIKSYSEGHVDEARKYLKYSLKYFFMLGIPSAFGLTILAQPLLSALTRDEYVSGYGVVPFVAFGCVIFALYRIGLHVIYLVNRTRLAVLLLGGSAILNMVLNVVLVPLIGMIGAAMATLIAYGVLGMLTIAVSRRHLKFDLSPLFVLKSMSASVVMTFCIWLLNPKSLGMVVVSIAVGLLVYFGTLMSMRGISRSEIRFFVNFARMNLGAVRSSNHSA